MQGHTFKILSTPYIFEQLGCYDFSLPQLYCKKLIFLVPLIIFLFFGIISYRILGIQFLG